MLTDLQRLDYAEAMKDMTEADREGYLADTPLSWIGASRFVGTLTGLLLIGVLLAVTLRSASHVLIVPSKWQPARY